MRPSLRSDRNRVLEGVVEAGGGGVRCRSAIKGAGSTYMPALLTLGVGKACGGRGVGGLRCRTATKGGLRRIVFQKIL